MVGQLSLSSMFYVFELVGQLSLSSKGISHVIKSSWPYMLDNLLERSVKMYSIRLLSNRWIINIQIHQCPMRQYRTDDVSLNDTFLTFRNRPSKPSSLNQRHYSKVVLSETSKYDVRRKSTFLDSFLVKCNHNLLTLTTNN